MTLNEAIKRYTSNAFYEKADGNLQGYLEFNQLAEWLKDYKRLLEQEPKTGHWINYKDEHQCSQCRETIIGDEYWEDYPYDYCPNCGAKMETSNDESID